MEKERGGQAKANEHWSRKPPHLLISPEKRSGVGKEVSRKIDSEGTSWLAEGRTVWLAGGNVPGGEAGRCLWIFCSNLKT